LKEAFLKGRPWKSIAWCLQNFQESPGTKGYTTKEFAGILKNYPVSNVKIQPRLTYVDTLQLSSKRLVRMFGGILSYVFSRHRFGWFLTIQFIVRR
jgi:hypothetical protein